jgi:hypothetical protein
MRFPPLSLLILLVLAVTRLTAALPVPITPVEGRAGMVVAGHPEAAEAGLAVLRAGGNAIDAAIATSLACGYRGMIEGLEPTEPVSGSAYKLPQGLARDLVSALDLLQSSALVHDVFGPEFVELFGAIKRAEQESYFQVISPWEREHLLLNV